MSELDAARVALERTYAGSVPGTWIRGYDIHLVRPGGRRFLVGVGSEDRWPQIIQADTVPAMLDAIGKAWRFTGRFGEPEASHG